jgi:hypothetical protein
MAGILNYQSLLSSQYVFLSRRGPLDHRPITMIRDVIDHSPSQ